MASLIKKIPFICLSMALLVPYAYSQKTNRISIPLVRENQKIDTLLDKYVSLGDPAKCCFVLYADPIGGMYGLTIKGVRTDTSKLELDFLKYKADYGYFNYKGYLVIVINIYDVHNFFDETIHTKTFRYKILTANRQAKTSRYFCSADYIFPDGRFWPLKFRDSISPATLNVKEVIPDRKIDSILDKYISRGDPARSCFEIEQEISYGTYEITISGVSTDTSLLNMNVFWGKPELGYFKYKGYKVIAVLRNDSLHYFHKTGRSQNMRFEFNERKSENKDINPLGEAFCYVSYRQDDRGIFQFSSLYDLPPERTVYTEILPVVKESKKIDSLLDILNAADGNIDNFIVINTLSTANLYMLSIKKVKSDTSLIKLHLSQNTKLATFRYKGNIIFVTQGEDPYNFFPLTSGTEAFRFESFGSDWDIMADSPIWMSFLDYKNGKFESSFPLTDKPVVPKSN